MPRRASRHIACRSGQHFLERELAAFDGHARLLRPMAAMPRRRARIVRLVLRQQPCFRFFI